MLSTLTSLLFLLSANDSLRARPLAQWTHTRWTAEEGAPAQVTSLAETTDGYLWVGTWNGVVRFDGVRFVPLVPLAGDTLPAGGVFQLLGARDGSLWILWGNGTVSWVKDGRVSSYSETSGLGLTRGIAESGDGTIVAAVRNGLARFDGTRWQSERGVSYPWTMPAGIWFDHKDGLWVLGQDSLMHRPRGLTTFPDAAALQPVAEGRALRGLGAAGVLRG